MHGARRGQTGARTRVYRPASSTIPRLTSTRCVTPGLRTMPCGHALHKGAELSDRGHLLRAVAVPVVHTRHRAIRVVEDAFDDKPRHAELRHRRAGGAPQIMRREIRDANACAN